MLSSLPITALSRRSRLTISFPSPQTFIKMGLRQLLVVKDGSHEIVGIITRHDLHSCLTRWPAAPNIDYLTSIKGSYGRTTSLAG